MPWAIKHNAGSHQIFKDRRIKVIEAGQTFSLAGHSMVLIVWWL